jgi:hypothetical protein
MFSIAGSSSAWRTTMQALQHSFRQGAASHPNLGHVVLQPLDEAGALPPRLETTMREAGGWNAGEIRARWELPAAQWKDGDARASYLDWWQTNSPAKLGYLFGDAAGRKKYEHLAERAWLALPGTPDGKAQAYPQPRPLERWMAFVYHQLASAPSPYLAADDELWVMDYAEDGQLIEQRFPPRAVKQGNIVSTGYPDAVDLSNRARRWIYTALATDPFTVSAVAIDLLLDHPDPEGPRLVSWQEMDAFQKSPAFQNANFLVDFIILANGRRFPIYRRDCKPVPGTKPSICPSAEPKPPVRLRPDGEMMAVLARLFRNLHLVGDGETIHWVGRQATVETTGVCHLSNQLQGHAEEAKELAAPASDRRVVLRGFSDHPTVCGVEKRPLTLPQYDVVSALLEAGERGLGKDELERKSKHGDARKILKRLAESDPDWSAVIRFPGRAGGGYRIG